MVGFGAVAENAHVPCLRALGVDLAAVAEPSAARRQAATSAVSGARVYAGHEELLAAEKNLDALIVATPPLHHAAAVRDGLRAGLHVLCEKPLTLDPHVLAELGSEAEAHGRALYTVNNWAFSPQWSRLLSAVAGGVLGAVRHAEIRVLRTRPSVSALPGDWRKDPAASGGGIFVDHGWHNLYLLRGLLGPRARLVSAVLSPEGAADETATALLAAPGATGVMHLTWRSPERANTATVLGEKGTAELRDDILTIRAEETEETIRFAEKLSAGSAHPEWLAAMWPAFEAECAGRGRGDNHREAAFCLQLIRSAYARPGAARA